MKEGVFVIIPRRDGFLLVRHNYGQGKWSLPGGGAEEGETLEEAAEREAGEETGRQISVVRKLGQFLSRKSNGRTHLFLGVDLGVCRHYDDKEISEVKVFSPQMLAEFSSVIYPGQKVLIHTWDLIRQGMIPFPAKEFLSPPFRIITAPPFYP